MKIKLTRKQLEAISHASTDSTRQALCCLYVEPGRTVATDGHRLAVVEWVQDGEEIPEHEPFIIPREVVEGWLKIIPRKAPRNFPENGFLGVVIRKDEGVANYHWECLDKNWNTLKGEFLAVDGKFPDYRQVIPSEEDTVKTFALSHNYIDDFGKLAADDRKKTVIFGLNSKDPANCAVRFDSNAIEDHKITGVIMPTMFDDMPKPDYGKYASWHNGIWPDWVND